MKVQSVRLINFQSHIDTSFDLSSDLTCIIGSGNAGKSSIIRALTFFFYGKPWDKSFVREGEKNAKIILTLEDGTTITREKGAVNKFTIKEKGEEKVFENFGDNIPEEIQQKLSVFPAHIGLDKELFLNIYQQQDSPFLLSDTGSTRAKVLGKLSNLHLVDCALRELSADRKRLLSQKSFNLEQNIFFDKELEGLKELDIHKRIMTKLGERIKALRESVQKLLFYKEIRDAVISWKQRYSSNKKLRRLPIDYWIKSGEDLLEKYEKSKNLKQLDLECAEINEKLSRVDGRLDNTLEEYKVTLEEYKQILPKISKCPLCLSDLNEEAVRKLLKEIEDES